MDKTMPVVICFPISALQVQFWCPFCKKWQTHGFTDDLKEHHFAHRVSECRNPDCLFDETGYYLKLATAKDYKKIDEGRKFRT